MKGIVLTGTGLRLRTAFWQRLVSEAGPLGALAPAQLAELRSLLEAALAGAAAPGPEVSVPPVG